MIITSNQVRLILVYTHTFIGIMILDALTKLKLNSQQSMQFSMVLVGSFLKSLTSRLKKSKHQPEGRYCDNTCSISIDLGSENLCQQARGSPKTEDYVPTKPAVILILNFL